MQFKEVKEYLDQSGFQLESLYPFLASDFSVLHQQACKEFLESDIDHHEFFCDVNRLSTLEVDHTALVLYESVIGSLTSVRIIPPDGKLKYSI